MQKYKFSKMKKSSLVDVKDFFIANYSFIDGNLVFTKYDKGVIDFTTDVSSAKKINVTSLLINGNHGDFYDIFLCRGVGSNSINYRESLSKYTGIKEGQIKVCTAKELASLYFGKFNKENEGKPKWWESKVSIEEAIPYLELSNSFVEFDTNDGKTSNRNKEKKHFHSKFTPNSQGVKSRKPIEDDFDLTM